MKQEGMTGRCFVSKTVDSTTPTMLFSDVVLCPAVHDQIGSNTLKNSAAGYCSDLSQYNNNDIHMNVLTNIISTHRLPPSIQASHALAPDTTPQSPL